MVTCLRVAPVVSLGLDLGFFFSSTYFSPCLVRCIINSVTEGRVRRRPLVRSDPCALSTISCR